MKKVNAVKVILLTILTFGIYGAYYIIRSLYLENDKNNDTDRTLAALWFMNNNNFH